MVEIVEGVWTRPLEIEKIYEELQKRKTEALVTTIEEEEAPWYYDIMKFLELRAYRMVLTRKNDVLLGSWQLNTSYVRDNSIKGPMMVYIFIT